MKAIIVDYTTSTISLSSAFAKKAFTPGSAEYLQLTGVRRDYPDFRLVMRQFKTNTKQEHYRGLTYGYMRDYITSHDQNAETALDELNELIGISKCHSLGKRYPTIKAWFLDRYPEVARFGMGVDELAEKRDEQAA